jgi:hypothetical protein
VRFSGQHDPLSFVPDRARVGPTSSCFRPTHLTRPKWSGIPVDSSSSSIGQDLMMSGALLLDLPCARDKDVWLDTKFIKMDQSDMHFN